MDTTTVPLRVVYSDSERGPLRLVKRVAKQRLTHVHVEINGWCLLGIRGTSGWTDSPLVSEQYAATEIHDLGPVAAVVPWLVTATTGWTMREDIREHLRWWRGDGPKPLNCVGLTVMALGLLGFDIDADTPDQLNEQTREAAARVGASHRP